MKQKLKKHKGLAGWLATGAAFCLILAVSSFVVPAIFADTAEGEMQTVDTDMIEEPAVPTAEAIAVGPADADDTASDAAGEDGIMHSGEIATDDTSEGIIQKSVQSGTEPDPGAISKEKAIQLAREILKTGEPPIDKYTKPVPMDSALVDSLHATAYYIAWQEEEGFFPPLPIEENNWYVQFEYPTASIDTLDIYLNAFTGKFVSRGSGVSLEKAKQWDEFQAQLRDKLGHLPSADELAAYEKTEEWAEYVKQFPYGADSK